MGKIQHLREIEHFFAIYKELEGEAHRDAGVEGPAARDVIRRSRERYLGAHPELNVEQPPGPAN